MSLIAVHLVIQGWRFRGPCASFAFLVETAFWGVKIEVIVVIHDSRLLRMGWRMVRTV